jgi:hypothetical protein
MYINLGAPIVRIPQNLILTKETARDVLGPEVITEELGEYASLALLLMNERAKGADSFWNAYIRILPEAEEVGQSWLWSEEDMALLKGSDLVRQTQEMRDKLWGDFELLWYETIYPNGLSGEVFYWEAYQWAMSMCFSRAVNVQEVDMLALVPYADLLNHSPFALSFFKCEKKLMSEEREIILYSDRNYNPNDQVLINYGQKPNAEMLLIYGFVTDRNQYDEVELTAGLSLQDPRYEEKKAYLKAQNIPSAKKFPLLIDRYSFELLQYLRIVVLSPNMGPLDSYVYNEQISVENERAAIVLLRQSCVELLEAYPESEEEDAMLMQNAKLFATLSFRQRQAIKLRRSEKRILLQTISTANVALDKVMGKKAPARTRLNVR